jgi:predicted ribosome quality control (RQC) complex YloA/Tae2 family protein
MMRSLSGLDLIAVAKELQAVVGSRIDKVYQPSKGEIEISISTKGEGKSRLRARLSGWIWLGEAAGDMPASPSSFASQLRKHISNARITGVSQHGCDRIIEFSLHKENESTLILELFGDGNVILTSGGEIVALLRRKKMKHRELKPKGAYQYPPAAFDPRSSGKDELRSIIAASSADIVRTLATKANLGGSYAEEICRRAEVPKDAPASGIEAPQAERIWEEIGKLVERLEAKPSPHISYEGGKPVGVSPIELLSDSGECKRFLTFSEAIEEYVSSLPEEYAAEKAEDIGRAKLERMLASQREALERLKPEIEAAQRTADFLFTNYKRVEETIAKVADGVKGGDLPDGTEIIDRARGRFRITIGGNKLILCWKKNVTENAQEFYDGVKKMRSKLDGVEAAVKETLDRIEKMKEEALSETEARRTVAKKRHAEWYESYRWFVSSEGAMVLAGKDAKSNDQLVKKHLQPGDRYVHADIHGAPSVVVKRKDGMTDATLMEAAIFSLCMSKAWNAGIGSGSAYWVTPEQVSKTPESGEFLAKGAWVIRGKRNYFERLELRLAVGICDLGKGAKMMCAPVQAIAKNCRGYIEIAPGEMPKEAAAKELAKKLSVDVEDVRPMLPPGGIAFIAEKGG